MAHPLEQLVFCLWSQCQTASFSLATGTMGTFLTQAAMGSGKLDINYGIAPRILGRSPTLAFFPLRTSDSFGLPVDAKLTQVISSRGLGLPTPIGTHRSNQIDAIALTTVEPPPISTYPASTKCTLGNRCFTWSAWCTASVCSTSGTLAVVVTT